MNSLKVWGLLLIVDGIGFVRSGGFVSRVEISRVLQRGREGFGNEL